APTPSPGRSDRPWHENERKPLVPVTSMASAGVVPYGERGAYADEFLAVLRTLWDDEEPAFAGRFFSFGPVKAAPKPWQQRRVHIAVGGHRPPALRRVARAGDCWHALGVSPDGMRTRLAHLD